MCLIFNNLGWTLAGREKSEKSEIVMLFCELLLRARLWWSTNNLGVILFCLTGLKCTVCIVVEKYFLEGNVFGSENLLFYRGLLRSSLVFSLLFRAYGTCLSNFYLFVFQNTSMYLFSVFSCLWYV